MSTKKKGINQQKKKKEKLNTPQPPNYSWASWHLLFHFECLSQCLTRNLLDI